MPLAVAFKVPKELGALVFILFAYNRKNPISFAAVPFFFLIKAVTPVNLLAPLGILTAVQSNNTSPAATALVCQFQPSPGC